MARISARQPKDGATSVPIEARGRNMIRRNHRGSVRGQWTGHTARIVRQMGWIAIGMGDLLFAV
jgi:hypothetical protein